MISYRDMTFCTYKDCTEFKTCFRAFTDQVEKDHKKFCYDAEFQIPVVVFIKKPDCYLTRS